MATLLGGYGGTRIVESTIGPGPYGSWTDPANPASEVFPGEQASNAEMQMRLLKKRGYNCIKAVWWGENSNPWKGSEPEGASEWNPAWFERMITLAKHYDLWVIGDYHDFYDLRARPDWLIEFWRTNIIRPYKGIYDMLVWEPIGEPVKTDGFTPEQALEESRYFYQNWINMCREEGDTHWIIQSPVGWWLPTHPLNWWANVTDPLNRTFITKHFYFYWGSTQDRGIPWTIEAAQTHPIVSGIGGADAYYNDLILPAIAKYGKPLIVGELGADPGAGAPGTVYPGHSVAYTPVTMAFVQRMINHLDKDPRTGYMHWHGSDCDIAYEGPPNRPHPYGCMIVWGEMLSYNPFPTPIPPTILITELALGLTPFWATCAVVIAQELKNLGVIP